MWDGLQVTKNVKVALDIAENGRHCAVKIELIEQLRSSPVRSVTSVDCESPVFNKMAFNFNML